MLGTLQFCPQSFFCSFPSRYSPVIMLPQALFFQTFICRKDLDDLSENECYQTDNFCLNLTVETLQCVQPFAVLWEDHSNVRYSSDILFTSKLEAEEIKELFGELVKCKQWGAPYLVVKRRVFFSIVTSLVLRTKNERTFVVELSLLY